MTAKILKFRPKDHPSGLQALRWLTANNIDFPIHVLHMIGPELFNGWRFIEATDGIIYFADCINRGITEDDLHSFQQQA